MSAYLSTPPTLLSFKSSGPEREQMDTAGFDVLWGHVYLQFYQGTQACKVNTPHQTLGRSGQEGEFPLWGSREGVDWKIFMHLCSIGLECTQHVPAGETQHEMFHFFNNRLLKSAQLCIF